MRLPLLVIRKQSVVRAVVLVMSTVAAAGAQTAPKPASQHTVHVVSSRLLAFSPSVGFSFSYQELDCIVDRQRIRLLSNAVLYTVLAPGDYQGTMHDESKPGRNGTVAFDLKQEYVLRMPDGTRRVYTVTGMSLPDQNP